MSALHVVEKGDPENPAVLLLHGLLGASRNLHRLSGQLAAAGFRAIAYDQRGHGHSPHGGDYALEALAADAIALLDQRGVDRAHWVGHSLGARVALAAAAHHPDRVLSLVLLDAGPKIEPAAMAELRKIVDPLPDSFATRTDADRYLAPLGDPMKTFLLSNLRAHDGRLAWVFDLAGIRERLLPALSTDQSALWRGLRVPTLLVRGEHSRHFSQTAVDEMLAANPGARSITVPAAGHWIHADQPDATARAILDFLGERK